jgi:His-Xaa-Ser system protein HxsD
MATEVTVEFQAETQDIEALRAAAYRLIGVAHCDIKKTETQWTCRIVARNDPPRGATLDAEALRSTFLDLVTDENLRLAINEKTKGVRNVILALAFGSLAGAKEKGNL